MQEGWSYLWKGLFLLGVGSFGYSLFVEPRRASVKRTVLYPQDLPSNLNGFSIGHLTDIHLGPDVSTDYVAAAIDLLMAHRPDLIVLTGDYIAKNRYSGTLKVLSKLTAPFGVYAVLGNHDYWADDINVLTELKKAGIEVLKNESKKLSVRQTTLQLVGLDDAFLQYANLDEAYKDADEKYFTLVLVHEPDYFDNVLDSPYRVDLQLSGHSHGGQVQIPFIGPIILPPLAKKYPHGVYSHNGTLLYTNRGLGVVRPPVRFNCPPEISLVELRKKS